MIPQAIHFRPYLVNRLSLRLSEGGTSLGSIPAINISAYGRLKEFHESSEARETKLPSEVDEIELGARPFGPFRSDRRRSRRNVDATGETCSFFQFSAAAGPELDISSYLLS